MEIKLKQTEIECAILMYIQNKWNIRGITKQNSKIDLVATRGGDGVVANIEVYSNDSDNNTDARSVLTKEVQEPQEEAEAESETVYEPEEANKDSEPNENHMDRPESDGSSEESSNSTGRGLFANLSRNPT